MRIRLTPMLGAFAVCLGAGIAIAAPTIDGPASVGIVAERLTEHGRGKPGGSPQVSNSTIS